MIRINPNTASTEHSMSGDFCKAQSIRALKRRLLFFLGIAVFFNVFIQVVALHIKSSATIELTQYKARVCSSALMTSQSDETQDVEILFSAATGHTSSQQRIDNNSICNSMRIPLQVIQYPSFYSVLTKNTPFRKWSYRNSGLSPPNS